MDNNKVSVNDELDILEDRTERFESYLQSFTTGNKDVKMIHVDNAFRDVKKSISKLRRIALKNLKIIG